MEEGKWEVRGNYGGYIDEKGNFIVCEEYGLTDAETDKYAVEVQNGDGYYNSEGWFIRYKTYDDWGENMVEIFNIIAIICGIAFIIRFLKENKEDHK